MGTREFYKMREKIDEIEQFLEEKGGHYDKFMLWLPVDAAGEFVNRFLGDPEKVYVSINCKLENKAIVLEWRTIMFLI